MNMIRLSSADTDVVVNALVWLRSLTVSWFAFGSGRTFSHADKLCFKNNVMLNELPVLTGCGVNLSVAGRGKVTTRTAGNAYDATSIRCRAYSDCTIPKMPTTVIALDVL